jgi:hypothetical protein
MVLLSYRCPVAVRVNAAKDLGVPRSEAYRALIRVIVITCVPVLGTLLAIVSTTEPDLSHLTPIRRAPDGYVLLNWFALQEGRVSSEASAQALGYMVESDRPRHAGEWVRDFVLLPDAGNLLHPAHRIPDQMIAIRLRDGEQIQFSPRSLVWVWGVFRESPADPAGIQPLYHLDAARVKRADKSDIAKYFQ